MNVWHGQAYSGFGPAACSFDGIVRKTEVSSIRDWLDGVPVETDELPIGNRNFEVFVMGLRTVDGWMREQWENCALPEKIQWKDLLELQVLQEFAEINSQQIKLTTEGLLFWDDVATVLL
jgi:coproporphyrinogen III oxidase-like Fe-S oxidoreductase